MIRFRRRQRLRRARTVAPEDVFLDAHNLPAYEQGRSEGRFERPIAGRVIAVVGILFGIVGIVFLGRVFSLQVLNGELYAARSQENRLRHSYIFAERGVIFDRDRTRLAWNTEPASSTPFAQRRYATSTGLAHVLGYLKYPSRDNAGVFYETKYQGKRGVEKHFQKRIRGEHGRKLIEINATNDIISESTVTRPRDGQNMTLSIDAGLQHQLYTLIKQRASDSGFRGGAGVIMDVETGEVLSLTSYPEFDPQEMTEGDQEKIARARGRDGNPFLNRVTDGQFIPGSIVKPFVAATALHEEVIEPGTTIVSKERIEVPNPYDEDNPTYFYDWKEHGPVTMRDALAVSSNIYFYTIGGGHKDKEGLGIERLARGMRLFGFGQETGIQLGGDAAGNVPDPAWKSSQFEDGRWRIGDTYNTAIGQFGFQVTPIQAVRATASLVNGGHLITPRLRSTERTQLNGEPEIDYTSSTFRVVREGMRQAVSTEEGTASGLDTSFVDVAAKTGTAEIGKASVNSWVIGFFPYEDPQYAFTVVLERGPRKNQLGGVWVMRRLLEWMNRERPVYLQS